ncbi:MAG: ATPase [Candidatus Kerfeldbacteria bacterium RIFOXYA2_FULL_38_24]|uniref:ATPase n=1 Tax=Candidatus Kerfeldbacteria bacterium RIFOXYB2_FULL_38_14 TaxID=1798547 RepID=A0A1G2BDL5_9BACT|nr:MAG: ATPase [Candidatus Kerfeldbacteria bacterium RIFOXYA2_FULL_38_24]OGY87222.1 MAG: ATPase [Candidatus Kerfeldbacteria bacterium RIFOXYB2_FULL_38_14]OGY88487.1 MAG: ATPase [Candidatus Kerfeldbacteria bacterium RIFOXYC2_FULL_38_9]
MIKRTQIETIKNSLKHFPIVGILGSRQVGKTTLAKELLKRHKNVIYLDLELTSDVNKLQAPEIYLQQHKNEMVIIDEIQRLPELFPLLRALVDQNKNNGQFLVLGSASPALIKKLSESLAGRIIYHELTPFIISEINNKNNQIKKLWLRGGYPKSFLAPNDLISAQWREAFIKTHLERDIPQLNINTSSITLRRFLTMVAHNHASLWNTSNIARSLGVSAPSVKRYLDIFTDTFIVRQLQPYFINIKKRLIKSPKVYIRDTGLLHALLNIYDLEKLQAHTIIGASWEGFIIEQLINIAPEHWESYFYRTNSGAEIDLLFLTNNLEPVAIEIKYSLSPKISKGFWQATEDIKCKKKFILYPGQESYKIKNDVEILSVNDFDKIFY